MKIAVLGGGSVGQTMAAALMAKGHDVVLGIRDPSDAELAKPRNMAKTLADWTAATGGRVATLAEAAAHGEVVFNATNGNGAIEALTLAGAGNLSGKVVVDISNPLDFSRGFPPFLTAAYSGPTSLGEQIQAAFPDARVVKAFNTVNASIMVNPASIPGPHDLFIAGEDAGAKQVVSGLARAFGWETIIDLGGISAARATESYLPLWVHLMKAFGNANFNIRVQRG